MSDDQIRKFGVYVGIDRNLLESFISFRLTVKGEDIMRDMGVKQGKELGDIINQIELMAAQLGIDKLKMEEQRKIQMQMWKDTNYAAQVEELKKAGLSIGLMYGKGGAGGTTTGAGATGVSAPQAPTGMGMIVR